MGKNRPSRYLGTTYGRCSKNTADFREAQERRHDTSSQAYRFNKNLSNRSPVQKRLSIYNWNPGPRRVLSLYISNIYAKKKCIAKKLLLTIRAIMISQGVDLVAGDFNGTACRCPSRDNLSTIDEVFADCALPTPPVPTPLW